MSVQRPLHARRLEQRRLKLIVLNQIRYDAQVAIGRCEVKVRDRSLDGRTDLIGKCECAGRLAFLAQARPAHPHPMEFGASGRGDDSSPLYDALRGAGTMRMIIALRSAVSGPRRFKERRQGGARCAGLPWHPLTGQVPLDLRGFEQR